MDRVAASTAPEIVVSWSTGDSACTPAERAFETREPLCVGALMGHFRFCGVTGKNRGGLVGSPSRLHPRFSASAVTYPKRSLSA